jgi:hypothetical protein
MDNYTVYVTDSTHARVPSHTRMCLLVYYAYSLPLPPFVIHPLPCVALTIINKRCFSTCCMCCYQMASLRHAVRVMTRPMSVPNLVVRPLIATAPVVARVVAVPAVARTRPLSYRALRGDLLAPLSYMTMAAMTKLQMVC